MTVEIRRGSARFVDRAPGRVTRHAFSFGSHYDPERVGFGPLICHDDHVLGSGRGFETHPHSDLEIVTWVVSGALRHTDSSGASAVLEAGSVGVLSTGDRVEHSEHATAAGPCRFVQSWLPSVEGESEPGHAARSAALETNRFVPVAQPRLDAVLWVARLDGQRDGQASLGLPAAPRLHVYVATGALLRSSLAEPLAGGDAFLMTGEPVHTVAAGVPTDLLVWAFHDGPAPIRLRGDGSYWSVDRPPGHRPTGVQPTPTGPFRLMADGGGFLWASGGAFGHDFDEVHRAIGLSRKLFDDLVQWGGDGDGDSHANTPEHDARGRALLARLRAECPAYEFVLRL